MKTATTDDCILSSGTVGKDEVVLALLYRSRNKPVAHLIKLLNVKGGKVGTKKALTRLWMEIKESFLSDMRRR